jgi:cellulose synthase/poly-beta-1,6-N-acetylglucosamine synthase-like glycosyltransferase
MIASTAMETLFWIVTGATSVMLMGTLYNLFSAPRLENAPEPKRFPRVSLLIPARNEEENLRNLMPLLSKLDYPDLEILILDDDSRDGTARVISYPGSPAKLIQGTPLPAGWLGKNWACSQLASASTGEVLIFCDADVSMMEKSIKATVSMMDSQGLDALTCLPRQIMGTWAEKAVLPVLLLVPVMGFMPIAFVSRLKLPALSLGCGQWFAFRKSAYDQMGQHAAVKSVIVEDMALGRLVKEKGMRLGVALSTHLVATRMYTSFPTVWAGFSKNLAYLTGTGWLRPPLILGLFLAVNALPWFMPFLGYANWWIPFLILFTSRILTAVTFREPALGWIWSPVGALLIPIMGIRSWWGYRRHSVQWKGRTLTAAFGSATGEV